MWLPGHEAERFCDESELGEAARNALAPLVADATQRGFLPGRFVRPIAERNPSSTESSAYYCLHRDGNRILLLAHVITQVAETTKTSIRVVGSMVDAHRDLLYDFSSDGRKFEDDGLAIKLKVPATTVIAIDSEMIAHIGKGGCVPRHFTSLEEFQRVNYRIDAAQWEARVQRGLFLPVN